MGFWRGGPEGGGLCHGHGGDEMDALWVLCGFGLMGGEMMWLSWSEDSKGES